MKNFEKEFQNPSNPYRTIPFWSWNDKMDPKEIEAQARELKKGGAGGFFMHARSGLKTEYLSTEWYECVQAGIKAGEREGLDAWIYDEEGWPSGFAGGIVPALSEDFHAKFISVEYAQNTDRLMNEGILCLYVINTDGEFKRIETEASYECVAGEELMAVIRHTNPYYIDTLNKRAVQAFLQCTHEEYYKRFGGDFGKHMRGFFTDEPRLTCNHFGDIAWSDDLPDAFIKKFGYDIRNELPALYRETDHYQKVRYDFWLIVSEMFSCNYMKTIYDWCEKHHCKATGHIMMEESIFSQMTSTAGVMPFYEYLHVPGIDWLRRRIDSPVIGKQVGSVACQLGKKQVLTESFALCGWGVSFEELKWIAEWQFVNGVNQICQHLMAYTIKGIRKRDYPPSHFIQQTWWQDARLFNDYLARECVALSYGDQTADVLLLHPLRSGYITYDGTRTEAIRQLDERFVEISEALSGQHISYHYGDETIIERYGKVEGKQFVVGRIAYQTVIMPHMHVLDKKTIDLLLDFAQNGGTILSTGRYPDFTNGSIEKLRELLASVRKTNLTDIRSVLEEAGLISLSIRCGEDEVDCISYQQRKEGDTSVYFLVNHSQEKSCDTTVTFFGVAGAVFQMHAETGVIERIASCSDGNDTIIKLHFNPMESYLLYLEDVHAADNYHVESTPRQEITLLDEWKLDAIDTNALTLDYCDYRVEGEEWNRDVPVIKVQSELLDRRKPCHVTLRFSFTSRLSGEQLDDLQLVLEDAQEYQMSVNGQDVSTKETGWWKDRAFRTVPIAPYVQKGNNEILLSVLFSQPQKVYDVLYGKDVYETEINKITYDIEIENIYLIGKFGVYSESPFRTTERNAYLTDGPFVLGAMKDHIKSLELTTQGFLFFAGTMTVAQTISVHKETDKRQILILGKQRAPLVKVYINDILVKNSLWEPYEADITEFCREGDNEIRLELYASNRNLLGPHHHIDGESYHVGPESFTGKWSWVERSSEADATDIADRTKNYWTDTYSFIKFGLDEE